MSTWYQLRTLDGCRSSLIPMRQFRPRIETALIVPHLGDLASSGFEKAPVADSWARVYEFRSLRVDGDERIYEYQEVWPSRGGSRSQGKH